ncbi:hypothetical protein JW887_05015 [Candidatus Dojkabacteria bacterium]|nr:hypothetical protein [Candidatus Dojkabacteria bacterium]
MSPIIQSQKDDLIFQDEDFSSKQVREELVGRKALSLFQLRDFDVPVPKFFALSSTIFSQYIAENIKELNKGKITAQVIQNQINEGKFDKNIIELIDQSYSRLSGFADAWVAVRSSIVLPQEKSNIAFAGVLDTILNIKGTSNILTAIKQIYGSLFTERTLTYSNTSGIWLSDIKVSIVIQKMVQSEVSGVLFTQDPITQDKDTITIESVFGLGEVISKGEITPDQYILNKKDLEFKEKKIIPQEWMLVQKINRDAGQSGVQKIKISKAWQHKQKLDDRYLIELAKIAKTIESKRKSPQTIEWVYESGKINILQIKDLQEIKLPFVEMDSQVKVSESILSAAEEISKRYEAKEKVKEEIRKKKEEEEKRRKEEQEEKERKLKEEQELKAESKKLFVEKPLERQVVHATMATTVNPELMPKQGEKLLITGIGASQGTFRGTIVIAADDNELKKQEKLINKQTVLVISDQVQNFQGIVEKTGSIITDSGGVTSDISILCREKGIPAIVGTIIASRMLKNNENVLIDGTVGAIYGLRDSITASGPNTDELVEKTFESLESPEQLKKATSKSFDQNLNEIQKNMLSQVNQPSTANEQPEKQGKIDNPIVTPKIAQIKTATKIFVDLSQGFLKNDDWKKVIIDNDGISSFAIEEIIRKVGRHPDAYITDKNEKELINIIEENIDEICKEVNGNPVIISIGSMDSGQYKKLVRGKSEEIWKDDDNISSNTNGLARLLKKEKELMLYLTAIKNARNKDGWKNISIAIEYPGSTDNFKEFKKIVSASKLRRSSTFNIFLTVNTPAEAMSIKEYMEIGLDGIIINTETLTKFMMASDSDDPSILRVIKEIIESKSINESKLIIKIPEISKNLLKFAVKSGITAITISDKVNSQLTRKEVSKIESELILS